MHVFGAKFNAYCDKFMPKNPYKEPMNTSSEREKLYEKQTASLCTETYVIYFYTYADTCDYLLS
jgi:hypothetical protein